MTKAIEVRYRTLCDAIDALVGRMRQCTKNPAEDISFVLGISAACDTLRAMREEAHICRRYAEMTADAYMRDAAAWQACRPVIEGDEVEK